ncbi:leucine--tRNA ligase [Patescibacteria group bacterium]|nr:leucine--tRNA ligase [Patescibacteria group bacterium]
MEKYNHKEIEKKWQKRWEESQLYKTSEDPNKPKTYVLDMFPYPSGEGLHVGHPKGYIATDIYSRFKRMQGHNVLHPMGWDAFGLPAENFAIKNKIHPRIAVEKNIATFKDQLSHIGFNYDWSREINTTDPEYYKWTQWIFLQLYKKGLAYQSNEPINWCPSCMTGLANEDLDGNVCERCGSEVEKRALPQWVLKITAYADRMLTDLDALDWPEHIKTAQRNWIGKSEGSEIEFAIAGSDKKVKVFTTRADTLFGATFLVLAPEHPLLRQGFAGQALENQKEVDEYIAKAAAKTEIERTNVEKEKTGVELKGVKAINPVNNTEIPIYVADYVLTGYGTGAIMAVPAHDDRDAAFAKKFGIEIRDVISQKFDLEGMHAERPDVETITRIVVDPILRDKDNNFYLIKEGSEHVHFAGGGVEEGETDEEALAREITEETGFTDFTIGRKILPNSSVWGYRHTKNKNQRSVGYAYEVVLHSDTRVHSEVEDGKHELVKVSKDKVLETITWPHHRYLFEQYLDEKFFTDDGILINSGNFDGLTSKEARVKITEAVGGKMTSTYKIKDWVFSRQRYWGEPIPIIHCPKDGAVAVPDDQLPVTLPEVESYEPSGTGESPLVNITEWVNTTCPTCGGPAKRETNTMPQWAGSSWYYLRFMDPNNSKALVAQDKEKYWAPVDVYVGGDHAVRHLIYARFWHKFLYDIGSVSTIEPFARLEFLGFILAEDGRKMSKRYGNVIDPTDVVATYGADAFRTYEMFMGPFENTVAWSTSSITGTARFIERVYKIEPGSTEVKSLNPILHQTIKKVTEDIEAFKFNTAISQMMILLNAIEKEASVGKEQWENFLRILAPFAPHVTDELWEKLGHTESIHLSTWPVYDPAKTVADTVTVAIQVNGVTRGSIDLPKNVLQQDALLEAKKVVEKWLTQEVIREIYVPGRIINFVMVSPHTTAL